MPSNLPDLSDRAQQLLKTLVERYIEEGQPVGSRALSKGSSLSLSPATIRNVMADLEEMGLVSSPHTSAGRIPTVSGYRFFVDSLLTVKPMKSKQINKLRNDLGIHERSDNVIESASKLLSDITCMAGVVTMPRDNGVSFRHIEFLSLSQSRVLVILVTNEQEVHNKIIHTSKQFSAAELLQAANYLNSVFEGKDLVSVRKKVLMELIEAQKRMNQAMIDAINMAHLAFQEDGDKNDYVLSGETNLMEFAELADMGRLRQLFEAFHQKRGIIHLLDQCLQVQGVQIFIGEEAGYDPLGSCSLVSSTYKVNDQVVGVLGVIGPTRMAYERVIPLVDVTAKILSSALNQKN
ncbi:MAG: heat-inducible transcriptional repressor HrcA [Methylococcales bacterium]